MKNLTLILIVWTFFVQSQNNVTVTVCDVKPDTVCAGQPLNIYFTLHYCQPGQYTGTYFKMHFINQSTYVWQGDYTNLTQNQSTDTLMLTITCPQGFNKGPVFVESNGSMDYTEYLNCGSVGIKEYTPNQGTPTYYDLMGNKVEPVPNQILIKNHKKVIIQN